VIHISVVIPVYGCKACLEELYRRLVKVIEAITPDFEIILVNDACPQNSWEVVKHLALTDRRVIGLDLSRNFGQIRAITAGLDRAQGDWVVVMDCDLQDKPEEIVKLYSKAQEGYDAVVSRRAVRRDSSTKKLLSRMFYAIYGYFVGGKFDATTCNFSISRRLVIENYCRMREQNRAFILFIRWMGFKSTVIDIDHCERASGKSSYSLRRRFRLATEIITSQSNKPLVLSIQAGFTISLFAFIYALVIILRRLIWGISVSGYASTIVSVWFIGGVILAQLGILGQYIGYLFDLAKNRPLYIVRETVSKQTSKLGGD
jgi:glycosyltransferase involved in cell wall biosynthesis